MTSSSSTTAAVNWLAFGPITDPYRQAVYKEIERLRAAGHVLDDLDVVEGPARTMTSWGDGHAFIQPFRVVVARSSAPLDPDLEQDPLPMEGENA